MLFAAISYLPQIPFAIVVVAILGINLLTYFLHDTLSAAYEDKIKSALHIQEKEFYFAQVQLMQESVKKVRAIRHDMNLHLAAIKDFALNNEDIIGYVNSLFGDISDSDVLSSTGNIAFDSIINFKLNSAKDNDIKLDLSLLVPPVVHIEVVDIVTILGNLLDNALDAVAKVEDKVIKLDIELNKGNLYINVSNTFDGGVKYAKRDGMEKYITTIKSGDEHGHGLRNIRQSVEKYNGHMDITHRGNIFTVGILLCVNPEG